MNERDAKRLERISEKLEQIKAQRQDILARERKRQRKERTHRLIQMGALSEKYFGVNDIQPRDYENFLKVFLAIENVAGCVAHAKAQTKGEVISQHEQRDDTESTAGESSGVPN